MLRTNLGCLSYSNCQVSRCQCHLSGKSPYIKRKSHVKPSIIPFDNARGELAALHFQAFLFLFLRKKENRFTRAIIKYNHFKCQKTTPPW